MNPYPNNPIEWISEAATTIECNSSSSSYIDLKPQMVKREAEKKPGTRAVEEDHHAF